MSASHPPNLINSALFHLILPDWEVSVSFLDRISHGCAIGFRRRQLQVHGISIDGFGSLADFEISDLDRGVNVFVAANGGGKSTLVEFLRGILTNFDAAQDRSYLPPQHATMNGGSITIGVNGEQFQIMRRTRPGHSDSISVKSPTDSEQKDKLHEQIRRLDFDLLETLFFVSGTQSDTLDRLTDRALRDGIELQTSAKREDWISTQIDTTYAERPDLFVPTVDTSAIDKLKARKSLLSKQIKATLERSNTDRESRTATIQRQQQTTDQLRQRADWTLQELEIVQTQLTEVNDRLWSRNRVGTTKTVEVQPIEDRTSNLRVTTIERELEDFKRVLANLAKSRYELSLAAAELSDVNSFSPSESRRRQRQHIGKLQDAVCKLREDSEASLSNSHNDLQLRPNRSSLRAVLESLSSQVELLACELAENQSARTRKEVLLHRKSIDLCEQQLLRQIRRLQRERASLLSETSASRSHFVSRTIDATETKDETTAFHQQTELTGRKHGLQKEWWRLVDQLCQARTRLKKLKSQSDVDESSRKLKSLQTEFAQVEQQLADSREQMQSLHALQSVMHQTRSSQTPQKDSPTLVQASEFLQAVTNKRYSKFDFDAETGRLSIVNHSGEQLRAGDLSRGTFEQAVLALRLALWQEYSGRGIDLPLILDEAVVDADEERTRQVVSIIVEQAKNGRQILLMTCHERLAVLFEEQGVAVREFPGTVRRRTSTELATRPDAKSASKHIEPLVVGINRIQPGSQYWLQPNETIENLPSLGTQMSRRLVALGVREISNLVELDAEATSMPLDSLQISAATLRSWQAESRLLCCVPNLTGKSAQLLVVLGVMSPSELSQASADDLHNRAQRLRRNEGEYAALKWLDGRPQWPTRVDCQNWIRSGREARTFRQAISETTRHLRHDHSHQAPKIAISDNQRRYYLFHSSPIADTPGIGSKTSGRLKHLGIVTVSDLLGRDSTQLARQLGGQFHQETIADWQTRANLMCQLPDLSAEFAEILTECGMTDLESIASCTSEELFKAFLTFVPAHRRHKTGLRRENFELWISHARKMTDVWAA